jgi:hypothetical protein
LREDRKQPNPDREPEAPHRSSPRQIGGITGSILWSDARVVGGRTQLAAEAFDSYRSTGLPTGPLPAPGPRGTPGRSWRRTCRA